MTGFGPFARSEATPSVVLAGNPVSSVATWSPIQAGTNWLNGSGAILIPGSAGSIAKNEISSGASGTWVYRAYTRAQAIQRVWSLTMVCRSGETGVTVDVTAGSAPTVSGITVLDTYVASATVVYVEDLAAQSAAVTDLSLTLAAHGGHVKLLNVTCYEQTRAQLAASASDNGIDLTSVTPNARIFTGNYATTIESVGGCVKALAASDPRRVGLFQWSVPTANPATRTGAYQAITGLGQPILVRKLVNGATTGSAYWSAYAKVNAGNGDVQIVTSHSGVTDSQNITATSFAWTTPKSISVDCEDLSAADGLQSATWDEVTINIRGNGGNTISVAAVSVFEEP